MKNLYTAFLKAQEAMPALLKDKTNPAFKASYATLAQVQDTAFPVLHKHGLVVLQTLRTDLPENGGLLVVVGAALVHAESGEQVSFELILPPAKTDPQGIGSAITYGRRFVLMTLLGLAPDDDDDGNAASNGARMAPAQARPQAKPQPQAAKPASNRPDWKGPNEAVIWAMEQGVYADEAAARDGLKEVLHTVYPGRDACKPHELPAVLDAFHADAMRRKAS
jgi:hypothetical protein